MSWNILPLIFPQPYKNVKTILSSQAIQKQVEGWIWPSDVSLMIHVLETEGCVCFCLPWLCSSFVVDLILCQYWWTSSTWPGEWRWDGEWDQQGELQAYPSSLVTLEERLPLLSSNTCKYNPVWLNLAYILNLGQLLWINGWVVFFLFFFLRHRALCGILVPRPGIEPAPLAVKARSPNHWTTREVPGRFWLASQSNILWSCTSVAVVHSGYNNFVVLIRTIQFSHDLLSISNYHCQITWKHAPFFQTWLLPFLVTLQPMAIWPPFLSCH